MDAFVSHSGRDETFVNDLVRLLREQHVTSWYFRDELPSRGLSASIATEIAAARSLIVVVSAASIARPDEVKKEIDEFLRIKGAGAHVIPLVLDGARAADLHPHLSGGDAPIYARVNDGGRRWRSDLLHALGRPLPERSQYTIGTVTLPYFVLIGGDGAHRYAHPSGIQITWDDTPHELPPELETIQEKAVATLQARNATLENKPMVRLLDYSWAMDGAEESEWPLKLRVGRTHYFKQLGSNTAMKEQLADGRTVAQKYAGDPEVFSDSVLANALATNLSVVTSDQVIFVATRGQKVAINPGGYSCAVSGTASPTYDLIDGRYSPFATAIREAREEVFSPLSPRLEEVVFFGLGRTSLNRFPLLFGELRTALSAHELQSRGKGWENSRMIGLPFTIDAVTEWVKSAYIDRVAGRGKPSDTAAMFSLIQSLLHEFPEQWDEITRALTFDARS